MAQVTGGEKALGLGSVAGLVEQGMNKGKKGLGEVIWGQGQVEYLVLNLFIMGYSEV